jgi:threonine dehydrogenase-like Zn-dependent dehydrogenase
VPYDAFAAGIGDYRIVTTLCPGGKERMRRLMSAVQSGRFDPTLLLTHSFSLDEISEGYRVFGERLDGVMKVAIRPFPIEQDHSLSEERSALPVPLG